MKLFKLSLVAAVAAGAFSTASAVALEEAIKDVDVSGWAWVRYQGSNSVVPGSWWKFKSVVNVKTKIDDNFFFLAGIRYGAGADKDGATMSDNGTTTSYGNALNVDFDGKKASYSGGDKKFMLNQLLVGYNVGGTTIMAGRYHLGTFFTGDMYGDGIKVVNTDVQGLTLAALWADALEKDGDARSGGVVIDKGNKRTVNDHNLYGVAAIGSYDPVAFQLWYAYLEDVTNLFAAEVALNFNVMDDFGMGVKAQYGINKFKGEFKDVAKEVANIEVADSTFVGAEASIKPFGGELSAGYVYYKAKDGKLGLSSYEDNGGFISAGEELIASQDMQSYSLYTGKNDYWFIKAGYKIPGSGVKLSADYLQGKFSKTPDDGGYKASEVVARVNYSYNKNLDFVTWYSFVKFKDDKEEIKIFDKKDEGHDKVHTFRAQARYKF